MWISHDILVWLLEVGRYLLRSLLLILISLEILHILTFWGRIWVLLLLLSKLCISSLNIHLHLTSGLFILRKVWNFFVELNFFLFRVHCIFSGWFSLVAFHLGFLHFLQLFLTLLVLLKVSLSSGTHSLFSNNFKFWLTNSIEI